MAPSSSIACISAEIKLLLWLLKLETYKDLLRIHISPQGPEGRVVPRIYEALKENLRAPARCHMSCRTWQRKLRKKARLVTDYDDEETRPWLKQRGVTMDQREGSRVLKAIPVDIW